LIGRRGQTLQSLQFIVNLIVRNQYGDGVRVVLDVERYRQRRENSLKDMATKVATRVVQSNRSVALEPMSPADRRIVHTALTNHPGVVTESTGMGDNRKVNVMPKPNQ
jgi:spoIIIJ-associated protein